MRRPTSFSSAIDRLKTCYRPGPRPLFICPSCRTRLTSPSQRFALSTSAGQRADSNSKVPFTEKIRRRIWGTDSPPGQEDPYGGLSALDRTTKKARSAVKADDAVERRAPDVLPNVDSYVPATTWDGLDQVGSLGEWENEQWNEDERFRGFIPPKKLLSREDLTVAVHRAVVEVFTLRDAARPMTDAANARDDRVIPETSGVTFTISGDNQRVVLSYPNDEVKESILQSTVLSEPVEQVMEVQAEADDAGRETINESPTETSLQDVSATPVEEIMLDTNTPTPSPAKKATFPRDPSWLNISLQDPAVKFAIIKRVTQLTGTRIPDPVIQQTHSVKMILHHLATSPKPKKLAQVLSADDRLTTLPNVRLFERRFTPIDREKEVGRWKVIERELERRGLPVTGNA